MAGRGSVAQNPSNTLNLASYAHRFQYNRSFTEKPNATTNAAWKELFPVQGGFFKHPVFATKRSTFAVFHQLHCLDGLRHGYWALFSIASEGKGMEGTEIPFHASPRHIRHCIDLLRNVLMCQPDLTLEVKDDELGGVTGFGTEHQCVNWNQLVDWTSQWETYQQLNNSKKEPYSGENGHHLLQHSGMR
ncbi:hypothetical protein GQ44DRAFT_738756 [Phaeosphaeriaceae sp. PMI808]|nr:hypothetical protein GQ44DRAFT_738756 [Phaeosphaeriaceae sp. PMI808]